MINHKLNALVKKNGGTIKEFWQLTRDSQYAIIQYMTEDACRVGTWKFPKKSPAFDAFWDLVDQYAKTQWGFVVVPLKELKRLSPGPRKTLKTCLKFWGSVKQKDFSKRFYSDYWPVILNIGGWTFPEFLLCDGEKRFWAYDDRGLKMVRCVWPVNPV